jgi:hypothetical protein
MVPLVDGSSIFFYVLRYACMSESAVPKLLISSALAYGLWVTIRCPCDKILGCHIKEITFVFIYCLSIIMYYNGVGNYFHKLLDFT